MSKKKSQATKKPSKTPSGHRPLKIVHVTDIHQGVPSLEPGYQIENLRQAIFPVIEEGDVDLVLIGGDLTDGALDMSGNAAYELIDFIEEICRLCIKHKTFLRALQGTFTHDRGHQQYFLRHTCTMDGRRLITWIQNIELEVFDEMDLSVMFKPDSLSVDVEKVFKERLMVSGLPQVDLLVNHGYFHHLLPNGIPRTPVNTLDADEVAKWVRGYVLNGHIHQYSTYGNCLNTGSINRYCHGDEKPKGFHILRRDEKKEWSRQWVENENTAVFMTFNMEEVEVGRRDYDSALAHFISKIPRSVTERNLRVLSDDVGLLQRASVELAQLGNVLVRGDRRSKRRATPLDTFLQNVSHSPITTDNFFDLLGAHLEEHYADQDIDLRAAVRILG